MLRSRVLRTLGAVTITGAMLIGAFSASASADSPNIPKIKCFAFSAGSTVTSFQLTACTGNTGGASMVQAGNFLTLNPLNLVWSNSLTTDVHWSSITTGGTSCPTGTFEYKFVGTVTADTTGSAPVGGHAHGKACVNSTGVLTVAPGTHFVFR